MPPYREFVKEGYVRMMLARTRMEYWKDDRWREDGAGGAGTVGKGEFWAASLGHTAHWGRHLGGG